MKQYQLNNITNALSSYLSARSNKKEAEQFLGQAEGDPNMDAYERAALRSSFKRDYSNMPEIAETYLGYRQKKVQQQQMQAFRNAQLAQQAARSSQMAGAAYTRNKQAAMKNWTTTIGNDKSPYYLNPTNPASRQAALEYGKRLGLSSEDMYLPGAVGTELPQDDYGYEDTYADEEDDEFDPEQEFRPY